jgi:hypothetical protein
MGKGRAVTDPTEAHMVRTQKILSIASGIAAALVLTVAPGVANADEPRIVVPAAGAEVDDARINCPGPDVAAVHRYWERDGVRRGAAHLWLHESGSTSIASDDTDPNDGVTLGVLVEDDFGRFLYFDPEPNDRNGIIECFGVPIVRWKWVSVYQGTGAIHNESLPWQDPLQRP